MSVALLFKKNKKREFSRQLELEQRERDRRGKFQHQTTTRARHRMRTPALAAGGSPALPARRLTEPPHLGRAFPIVPDFLPQSGLAEQGASIEHLAFMHEKKIFLPQPLGKVKNVKKKKKPSRVHLLARLPGGPQAQAEAGKNRSAPPSFSLQTHQPDALKCETPSAAPARLPQHRLSAASVIKACSAVSNCKGSA